MNPIEAIVFDLGGVIIELSGVPVMAQWLGGRVPKEELWKTWLHSKAVRVFESGSCSPEEFADAIIKEMDLPVSVQKFIDAFERWPIGLFPGTKKILLNLRKRYHLAVLSNTNVLHWPRFMNDFGLSSAFDSFFPSHVTGKLKPDYESYRNVCQSLSIQPSQILFFDDNEQNVLRAQDIGIRAHKVNGIDEALAYLLQTKMVNADEGLP